VPDSTRAIDERFEVALSAARSAGRLALDYFARATSLNVEHKGTQDLVSEADRETEHLITRELLSAFPGDAFVGEEHGLTSGHAGAGTWVVDPIDGTQPFLLGLPTWCISIAYADTDGVQVGVVYNPVTDETYAARRGAGATRNGTAIQVRAASALSEGLTGVGCSPRTQPDDLAEIMRRLLNAGGMYQRTGSGALNLAYVAAGQLIGYVEMHIHAWDCLAAVCLIEEAGGTVSPFLADHGVSGAGPLIAGSPGVYRTLCELLPPH
jgi:myo-inositol-1(or 4)-monophosphatase